MLGAVKATVAFSGKQTSEPVKICSFALGDMMGFAELMEAGCHHNLVQLLVTDVL